MSERPHSHEVENENLKPGSPPSPATGEPPRARTGKTKSAAEDRSPAAQKDRRIKPDV